VVDQLPTINAYLIFSQVSGRLCFIANDDDTAQSVGLTTCRLGSITEYTDNFSTGIIMKPPTRGGAGIIYVPPLKEPHKEMTALTEKKCSPFIVSTTSGKPDAATRRLIRSHVMAGKNRAKAQGVSISLNSRSNGSTADQFDYVHNPKPSLDISGAGLSVVNFADDMQPYMLDLVFQCQSSPILLSLKTC
jgi:hypothetical protein